MGTMFTGEKSKQKEKCYCDPCRLKSKLLKQRELSKNLKRRLQKFAIILGLIFFAFVAYNTSQVELDSTNFDLFKELGIDKEASIAEIKCAYRHLTMEHHPYRGGDEKTFLRIVKAYQALTDEEDCKNWEEHVNQESGSRFINIPFRYTFQGATHLCIALPKWILEKQSSMWVLAVYALFIILFMAVLLRVVDAGTKKWYIAIQYRAGQILMDTTQLYFYLFHKTPNMDLKRVIMILGASFEFENGHNQEIVQRHSDNEEIPMIMADLPNLDEKHEERPLCCPYSVKARAMIHAHLSRLNLPPETLELDKQYILRKCPDLINEMVNIFAGRVCHAPRLDTLEHCMKLSQMIVQGLWESKSPLLQLPHIKEDSLCSFVTKGRNICNIQQFVSMKDEDRRNLLQNMSEQEYNDTMNVCAMMPHVTMEVRTEVLDDEDRTITAGSIVTVSLKRESLLVKFNQEDVVDIGDREEVIIPDDEEEKEKERVPKVKNKQVREENKSMDDTGVDEEDEDEEDEEDDWVTFQKEAKKETKSKETHLVHCPFFPDIKYEWWWLYIADEMTRSLITAPVLVNSLRSKEKVHLKVFAPDKPGIYQLTVILRSDSYLDFDLFRPIKTEVKEALKFEFHPQWEFEGSEGDEEASSDETTESDFTTDDDDTD